VVGGLSWTYSWGNDAGAATTVVTIGATFDDSITQANGANGVVSSMDGIAFALFSDAPYGPGNTGSYTVSDVVVSGVNAIPEPASAGLLLLGTLLTVGRRRRQ
jgi:tetrahydromethanopterin S-methyltransferase subunit C